MKDIKFYLGVGAFTLSSAMIPLMAIFTREKNAGLATGLAIVFWLMLIIGIVATILFGKSTKPLAKKKARAFLPFQTQGTMIVDPLLIISLIATVVVLIGKFNVSWLEIVLMFATAYLLELHFILSLTVKSTQIRRKNKNDET